MSVFALTLTNHKSIFLFHIFPLNHYQCIEQIIGLLNKDRTEGIVFGGHNERLIFTYLDPVPLKNCKTSKIGYSGLDFSSHIE